MNSNDTLHNTTPFYTTTSNESISILEQMPHAILLVKDDSVIFANKRCIELMKCSCHHKTFAQKFSELVNESKEQIEMYLHEAVNGKEHAHHWELRCSEGEHIMVTCTMKKITIQDLTCVIITFTDIEHFIASNNTTQKYEDILTHAETAILKLDNNGRIYFANSFVELILGYSYASLKSAFLYPDIVSEDFVNNILLINDCTSIIEFFEKQPYSEFWCKTKNGKQIFMAWRSKQMLDDQGNKQGIMLVGSDITEQNMLLSHIKENENKFRQVFNSIADSIIIFDPETLKVVEINDVALFRKGIHSSQIYDLTLYDFVPQSFIKQIPHLSDVIKEKIFVTFEFETSDFRGRTYPLEISARLFKFCGRDMIIAVGRDISERTNAQRKMYNAVIAAEEHERMRIARELHDGISPTLSTVKLYIQSLSDVHDDTLRNTIYKKIEETAEDAILSLIEISNNISPHILQNFGIEHAIRKFIKNTQRFCTFNTEFTSSITQRLQETYETTLYRVATELINNAIKHSDAKNVTIDLSETNTINLHYSDDGCGFEIKKTLETAQGMGLFNIDNRIKSLNGTFEIHSDKNKGVQIAISLPKK